MLTIGGERTNISKKSTLPSEDKGTWSGERGNSYFVPNDERLRNECFACNSVFTNEKGETVPGIPFKDGKANFDSFASMLNGQKLIGNIPFPTEYRTVTPDGRKYDAVKKRDFEEGGSVHCEYDKSLDRKPKVFVYGDNINRVTQLESKALGDRGYSLRSMAAASNYNQAFASISENTGIAQNDFRFIVNESGKPLSNKTSARLVHIAEYSGYRVSDLEDLMSRKLTVHEQICEGPDGEVYACGIIMPYDFHSSISHEGLVSKIKSRCYFENDEEHADVEGDSESMGKYVDIEESQKSLVNNDDVIVEIDEKDHDDIGELNDLNMGQDSDRANESVDIEIDKSRPNEEMEDEPELQSETKEPHIEDNAEIEMDEESENENENQEECAQKMMDSTEAYGRDFDDTMGLEEKEGKIEEAEADKVPEETESRNLGDYVDLGVEETEVKEDQEIEEEEMSLDDDNVETESNEILLDDDDSQEQNVSREIDSDESESQTETQSEEQGQSDNEIQVDDDVETQSESSSQDTSQFESQSNSQSM